MNETYVPYRGLWVALLVLCLPSVLLTGGIYKLLMLWQPEHGFAVNWATGKFFGCGVGMMLHFSCAIAGVFKEPRKVAVKRLKEFFSNLTLSRRVAFHLYKEDWKENGMEYWIYFVIIVGNIWMVIDGLVDFLLLEGML